MNAVTNERPVILFLSGLDPSGGAGLAADIEAAVSFGCRPAPIATAITEQDTRNVYDVQPLRAAQIIAQAETIMADIPVSAIKIGMLGSAENALAIAGLLDEHSGIPVVLDPILRAGGGANLVDDDLIEVIRGELLRRAHLVTPNHPEAETLAELDCMDSKDAATRLLELGAHNVLITGGHAGGNDVQNTLYRHQADPIALTWPRLNGEFHGSGCTLASACAAGLARGLSVRDAVAAAEHYTNETLRTAGAIGHGQLLPNRLYWATDRPY